MKFKSRLMQQIAIALLSLSIVGIAILAAIVMWVLKPEQEREEPREVLPTVEVLEVASEDITLTVNTQGTVEARTETQLTAEVSGLVEWVAPSFVDGGFFESGQILLRINALEYESRVAEAESRLAQAHLALAQEKALAEQARQDWEELGRGNPSDLVLREPQLASAEANVKAARRALKIAERNLRYTEVRAPYAGRVSRKQVDVGQAVNARTSPLAEIYSVESAQIRLPITKEEVGFLEIPEQYRNATVGGNPPTVILRADYGGRTYSWEGVITRTEGTIDTRSRLMNVIAEVDDPYALRTAEQTVKPPFKVGMFVRAEIQGRHLGRAFRIPRSAIKPGNVVYIVGADNRLESRELDVVKMDADHAIISDGLEDGERLCLTPLVFFVEGMRVNPEEPTGSEGGVPETPSPHKAAINEQYPEPDTNG